MGLIRALAFLYLATLASTQVLYDHQINGTHPPFDYEKIAKLLQAPLFRNDPPAASAETVSSYLPQNYEIVEPKLVNDELKGSDFPSLNLQPPPPEAKSLYYILNNQQQPQSALPTFEERPTLDLHQFLPVNPHSKQLDLPLPNTPSKNVAYPPVPATDLQLPLFEPYSQQFNSQPEFRQYVQQPFQPENPPKSPETFYPTLSETLELPKTESIKPQYVPTSSYPKKYNSKVHDYKPKKFGKNIPVIEIVGDEVVDVSDVKKSIKPQKFTAQPVDEEVVADQKLTKQRQRFEDTQKKIALRKENEEKKQRFIDATLARASAGKGEQVASETGFNSFQHEGAHFAAPLHQASSGGLGDVAHGVGAAGDRTEFQMFGQHGPHSYKFGYDTGKGKNRQFRYEERDNEGIVKGHYGFYDKHGKLQVINYDAHPHHGFHAEGAFGRA